MKKDLFETDIRRSKATWLTLRGLGMSLRKVIEIRIHNYYFQWK